MTKVMFFHAPWCHGCKHMVAPFNTVKKELETERFKFESYDVEEDDGNELSCKFQVRNVPTILIVKEGNGIKDDRVINRIAGSRTLSELFKEIKKWR